ncbi:hypothetical protein D1B31_13955 [Neobacillus notoginsengisoli]|uniref:ATP-grasp domain-containing protein n=1 Tax=Neobacillus notoginsengisoli TaxID=1578198 RepID=A0A417YSU4_9BACI|nr:YheC/YheD family protein [Neobacillus notoginsengisoli]RHW39061.1 hypothetical protein D1B31_13955 [Neobacillus notoginsengisoli]
MKQMSFRDKWALHTWMKQHYKLKGFLPVTEILKKESLERMVGRYERVMVKPTNGAFGRGIVQISRLGKDSFELHHENFKTVIKDRKKVFELLTKWFLEKNTPYMIQNRIPLATIGTNPFDIRVMVQKKNDSDKWAVTAACAKLAEDGFVITNASKAILPVKTALNKSSLQHPNTKEIIEKLRILSLMIVEHLSNWVETTRAFGIDLGVDQQGLIWIIEANLRPTIDMFQQLNDHSYERIQSYL